MPSREDVMVMIHALKLAKDVTATLTRECPPEIQQRIQEAFDCEIIQLASRVSEKPHTTETEKT